MVSALYLMLDVCLASAEAVLRADSQIAALKCVQCQNLHVDTIPITVTSKYICQFSVEKYGTKIIFSVVIHWHC